MIEREISQRPTGQTAGKIKFVNDTSYTETPSYLPIRRVVNRTANSWDEDRTEYEILKRRFNEAVNASKKQ